MKKILTILSLLTFVFAFSACTQEEAPVMEDKPVDVMTDKEVVEDEPVVVGEDEDEETSGVPVEVNVDEELSIADEVKDDPNKTIKDCEVLTDEGLKENCFVDVYTSMALEERDENYCDKIAVKRDQDYCKGRLEHISTFKQVDSIEESEIEEPK